MSTGWQDGNGNSLTEAELARLKGTGRLFRDAGGNPQAEYEWTDPDTGTTYTDGPRAATEDEAEKLVEMEDAEIVAWAEAQVGAMDWDTIPDPPPKDKLMQTFLASEMFTASAAREFIGWTPPDGVLLGEYEA